MIVSWNWLNDFVPLKMTPAELVERLMMAGLNHESTEQLGNDWAIDLEVTSNRPDCLGHIGIAREAAVLFDLPLRLQRGGSAQGGSRERNAAAMPTCGITQRRLLARTCARVTRPASFAA